MRYFLVSFSHSKGFGMINFTCNNCYLNRDLAVKQIEKDLNIQSVILISITELNEKDFKQFNEK